MERLVEDLVQPKRSWGRRVEGEKSVVRGQVKSQADVYKSWASTGTQVVYKSWESQVDNNSLTWTEWKVDLYKSVYVVVLQVVVEMVVRRMMVVEVVVFL